ncbi:MAG: BREX-2 system adenine-specific DNA-methyltransferase PglX [Anaerolineales bacterium]|nr:BREX-2 system adenine-specific DNA-methyltransferase PglX [Anaerolineales bacterium]
MEFERYLELQSILQQWKTRLAESIRQHIETDRRLQNRLQTLYQADGASEEFTIWLDRWCRQAAIQFILRILFLRVLEDRGLLGATRIRATDGQMMWAQLTRNLGAAAYVQWCCWDAAHLLPDLFGPTDYDWVLPEDELAQRFLDEVWRRPDPNRPGWLRFDFRQDHERGSEGFQTRFIGDLYQDLDAEIRERYALLQTPDFISQFILEHTLLKSFEEKDFREVTMIDPTCGSGHFLVDGFWHFVRKYENESSKNMIREEKIGIARRIIEHHIFGCDINPYATALTRFRLILSVCDYANPTNLAALGDMKFNIVTIDSLIPYEKIIKGETWGAVDGSTAKVLGHPVEIDRALPILRKRYEIVVGNPPYIVPKDDIKKRIYRDNYVSAYLKYGLSAPFTERFLGLLTKNGRMGIINSISFSKRQFGKRLIENVLPEYKLNAVVDLSGSYIPGHGTPTIILFVSHVEPGSDKVKFVGAILGEPQIPSDPSKGLVWMEIYSNFLRSEYDGEFISIKMVDRNDFNKHPWNLQLKEEALVQQLVRVSNKTLSELTEYIGTSVITGQDEIYALEKNVARRFNIPHKYLRNYLFGVNIRDWILSPTKLVLFPYNDDLEPIDIENIESINSYLRLFRNKLSTRTSLSGNSKWFELCRMKYAGHDDKRAISIVLVTTHNQFMYIPMDLLVQQGAPALKLHEEHSSYYFPLLGLFNTSIVCFFLKQRCYNKKPGKDPVRDNYEYTAVSIGDIPIPITFDKKVDSITYIVDEILNLSNQIQCLSYYELIKKKGEAYQYWDSKFSFRDCPTIEPFNDLVTLQKMLKIANQSRENLLGRMIFLQEELDWLSYELFGLIKKAPLAEDLLDKSQYDNAILALGQRPFELAGFGYNGDWPIGYKPPLLPDYLKNLTEARIAIIESNLDIGILEDPRYKRRWAPPDYKKEFQEAAEWWLAEKLEFALEQYGKPITLRQWVRLLHNDTRVNAVLEVLTNTQAYDLEGELLKVIQTNSVPNRPEHYLKPSGLRKNMLWQQQDETSIPPEFKRGDFSDGTAWSIRGKLNIPRERFIVYNEFDHTCRGCDAPESGGPWFGWAGWDTARRADALAFLLEQANRAGWELRFRQCGLRAALRDLLPQLEDLPEADQLEFRGLATMCGISLETECYCQSYREGLANGRPTVPGVSEELLDVKVLASKRAQPKDKTKKTDAEQLSLDM